MAVLGARPRSKRIAQPRLLLIGGLPVLIGGLALALLSSIAFGAADIDPATVWNALFHFDGSTEHLIIRTLRAPRALVAALVGSSLGIAGALMQGITRNPLADPGILGINAGAALAVVLGVFLFGAQSLTIYALFAFVGAGVTAVTVYVLGSLARGGPTPLNLTVAGAAVTAFISSLTTAVLIFNQRTLEEIRFWLAGSVAGRDLGLLIQVVPYVALGIGGALLLGRQVTTLTLGEDVAKGLGQRTGLIKALAAVLVVLLAGSAVAVAGPIGFVGLVIPHVVRLFIGVDYRWILPYAALVGAIFLVLSDVAARVVLRPMELPVGVMTALIGGPCFMYLVRWKVRR